MGRANHRHYKWLHGRETTLIPFSKLNCFNLSRSSSGLFSTSQLGVWQIYPHFYHRCSIIHTLTYSLPPIRKHPQMNSTTFSLLLPHLSTYTAKYILWYIFKDYVVYDRLNLYIVFRNFFPTMVFISFHQTEMVFPIQCLMSYSNAFKIKLYFEWRLLAILIIGVGSDKADESNTILYI